MLTLSVAALAVLEHASDAVIIMNDEGEVEWVNEAMSVLVGYSRKQLVGRSVLTLIDEVELANRPIRNRELSPGQSLRIDRTVRHADGSGTPCEVAVTMLPDRRIVALVRDISVRTAEQARLQRSEESFRTLAEKLPDAIAIHRAGKFIFCNRAVVALLGYTSADQLIGMPIIDIVHPESRPAVAPRLASLATGVTELPWFEERILRRDGTSLTMEIASIQMNFQEGPAVVVVGRDITERKALQLRLAEADRMASIGTLAAGIAHEINNPLTYVALNLEGVHRALGALTARGGTLSPEVAAELYDKISAAIEGTGRVSEIVTGLRRFAHSDQSPKGPIDVARAIEAAVRLIDHELRLRARLVLEQRATRGVLANEGRLTQVLVNLLSNASQAIPEGQADRHSITIRSWDSTECVHISVTDTGIGIPPDVIPRVFDPFFTTKDPGAGVGLGLAISHGIITGYGGSIEVSSAPGQGTTFNVSLPASDSDVTAPVPLATIAVPPPAIARHRVLVVDDEAMIRKVVRQVLGEDYEVEPVASGRAAIERLAQSGDVDVVLCDLSMPDVSGVDVYKWVEENRPELCERMIFSSGANHPIAARFPERWLDKPFGVEQLRAIVADRIAATRRQ
ncbi:MAG: PAS domain S-box protein [Kofleriaceae bacterium]|nr:PAS domain S-box protein [Kofleriaceae bacterium]